YKSSFFRAAQVGMNFLWSESNPIDYAGNVDGQASSADLMPNWFTLIAGKRPFEAPDAIVWLREAWVRTMPKTGFPGQLWGNTPKPVRNMERMLSQVDLTSDAGT